MVRLKDQSGMITIITVVLFSCVFFVLMGVAGVKLLQTARESSRMNEAYNYLVVMEEIGQAVARARTLGRLEDCSSKPLANYCNAYPGTVKHIFDTPPSLYTACSGGIADKPHYTLCVPNTDGDGLAEASDFCATVGAQKYCLTSNGGPWEGLERLDVTAELAGGTKPPDYGPAPGGIASQITLAGPVVRANMEYWTPLNVTWANVNEIYTTTCGTYPGDQSRYWLGCNFCADPNIDCWQMSICRPGVSAATCSTAAGRSQQGIMIYFDNNRP